MLEGTGGRAWRPLGFSAKLGLEYNCSKKALRREPIRHLALLPQPAQGHTPCGLSGASQRGTLAVP